MTQLDTLVRPTASLPRHGTGHVVVIGGGASGVLMAAHLLSQGPELRVTILEAANILGCGLAYSTTDPDHLLNTRVGNMSAFPGDPGHFSRWLSRHPEGQGCETDAFVSRGTYGAYLTDLLKPWLDKGSDGRLACVRRSCVKLEEASDGVVATLDDGEQVRADMAVLATGHVLARPDESGLLSGAWEGATGVDPDGRIVIIGSGLSMVDQVLSLIKSGHRGPIVTLSRRGLLPRPHADANAMKIDPKDIPFGAKMSEIFRWARDMARKAESEGGTWRDAVDGLRPHVRAFWRMMPLAERRRFLRHAVVWWDVHRHRIPPQSDARISAAVGSGQLIHQRGTFLQAERGPDGDVIAVFRPHGQPSEIRLPAARIIDCRGIRNDPEHNASPLFADLLASGRARVDPLRIGLEVTDECRIIDTHGNASQRIIAMGPVSRAAFWEITAIPDIREQAARLGGDLAEEIGAV